MKPERIYLIGSRGSGKSTVGQVLAEQLKWSFADCDVGIEQQTGMTIAKIFAEEGETSFRNRESQHLRDLAHQDSIVVATGGGVVIRAANRAILQETGFSAWLTARNETLWNRIDADPTTKNRRPALTNFSGAEGVAALLSDRIAFYTESAHAIVNTDGETPTAIAAAIIEAWTNWKC